MNRKQYVSPIMERIIIASQPMLTSLFGNTNGGPNITDGGNASDKGNPDPEAKFWDDDDDWDE